MHFLTSAQRYKGRATLEARRQVLQEFRQMPDRPTFIIQSTMRNGDQTLMLSNCLISLSSHCLFLNPATQCSGRETVIHLPLMAVSDYQQPGPAWISLPSRHLSLVLQPLYFCNSFTYLLQHLFIHSFNKHSPATFCGQAWFCSLRSKYEPHS